MSNPVVMAIRSQVEKSNQQKAIKEQKRKEVLLQIGNNFRVWLESVEPALASEIKRVSDEEDQWALTLWQVPVSPDKYRSKMMLAIATQLHDYFRHASHKDAELEKILGEFLEKHYEGDVRASFCLEGSIKWITLWWGDEEPKRTAL